MPGVTLERNDSVMVNRCTCVCLSVKKDRMCVLTVLGAFEIIIALASLGMGNWAVISYGEHLRRTAAFNFWSGGAVSIIHLFTSLFSVCVSQELYLKIHFGAQYVWVTEIYCSTEEKFIY